MQFNKARIRQPVMTAHDLFSDKIVQVFAKKTGMYLGYVYLGEDPELIQEEIAALHPETISTVTPQLTLF